MDKDVYRMMQFLRRYQKYFYIAITAIIVLSFTFFGTYSAFVHENVPDPVAFHTVDGTAVYQSELQDMVRFLSSSASEAYLWSYSQDGNMFNDGVITKDFLTTGIAEAIVPGYLAAFRPELALKSEREKRFVPYVHPHASFIGAEQVWNYFAPQLKKDFDELRQQSDPASKDAFRLRVQLFLANRYLPPFYVRHLIRYQEKEHEWLEPDEELDSKDLALFGYHSIQDWFGRSFVEFIAAYILNASKIAESKGYSVQKAEVMGSLQENLKNAMQEREKFGAKAMVAGDVFHEQLRALGMDLTRLERCWESVLLFRRMFYAARDSVIVSPLVYEPFYRHQSEYADVLLYRLPPQFHCKTLRDLEKLELYLRAVQDPKEKKTSPLQLPTKIASVSDVRKIAPELVKKTYRVSMTTVNKDQLQTKIPVRDVWNWEIDEHNFGVLQAQFPELAKGAATTADERFSLIEMMDSKTRLAADAYSRAQIVAEHPEWLEEAMNQAAATEKVLELRDQGGQLPQGIKNPIELMQLLDATTVGEAVTKKPYTQDKVHYYRFVVLEAPREAELMSFKDASQDGTMSKLFDKVLESTYQRMKNQKAARILKDDGEYKPLSEVRDQVAQVYFEDFIRTLDAEVLAVKKAQPACLQGMDQKGIDQKRQENQARIAARFFPYMKQAQQAIEKNEPSQAIQADQLEWKLVSSTEQVSRGQTAPRVGAEQALEVPVQDGSNNQWSELVFSPESGLVFFKVLAKGTLPYEAALRQKVTEARELLGSECIQSIARQELAVMQKKQAMPEFGK